jgi:hypothetical protein
MRTVGSAGRYGSGNKKGDQWGEMEVEIDSRIIWEFWKYGSGNEMEGSVGRYGKRKRIRIRWET